MTVTSAGTTNLNADIVTTDNSNVSGSVTFNSAVMLTGATSIDLGGVLFVAGGNITFNDTVDGTQALTLETNFFGFFFGGGNIFFNEDVGSSVTLGDVTIPFSTDFTLAATKVFRPASFTLSNGLGQVTLAAKDSTFSQGLITEGNLGTISIRSRGITGTIVNSTATAAGTVILNGNSDLAVNIGAVGDVQFGVLTIGTINTGTYVFTNTSLIRGDDGLNGSTAIANPNQRSCSFNGIDCTVNNELLFDFIESIPTGPFTPPFPASKTGTDSLDNTPAQAAFNDDPLEGEFAVDVFGTEFELVEAAGGAEAAYTGLNYVFQDFWEFLAEGEGGEGEGEGDEGADECDEDEELVGGECV